MLDTPVRTADHEAKLYGNRAAATPVFGAMNPPEPVKDPLSALDDFLGGSAFDSSDPLALGTMLAQLVERGYDRLPLPGSGRTLLRWRALAAVAACDLGLVKLFEGHTDALAILAELQEPVAQEPPLNTASRWGVWAAEAPDARLVAKRADCDKGDASGGGMLLLNGTKAWCSGARVLSHALVTAWLDDQPVLAAVELKQPSISISIEPWHAVGMRATQSGDVHFDATPAQQVGASHAYVERAGFWQGGAGIAACWYGAAAGIAQMMAAAMAARADAHRLAHLGAVDVALAGAAAVLRESAAQIDANPAADHQLTALRARLAVEAAATEVMHHAGRALGAAPLCRNPRFARAMADLPVFLRQSHAERDLAALGEMVRTRHRDDSSAWAL
jgi:alkylation response protein AidB-like acyl-CoA dehydrogenase